MICFSMRGVIDRRGLVNYYEVRLYDYMVMVNWSLGYWKGCQ